MLALVVDDSRVERELLARTLEAHGLTVERACSGEEALELLDNCLDPDILFVDLYMPGMDGIDLIRRVRSDHRFTNLKIIMVSSADDQNTIAKSLRSGADDYVMKPYTQDAILRKLSFVLEGFADD